MKRPPTYALTDLARARGVTIAPAERMLRCDDCGIAMTPLIRDRPADDQIRIPGVMWPSCVRCGVRMGLVTREDTPPSN